MGFKIVPFGGQKWAGHYGDHGDLRQYLGFKRGAKLPLEFSAEGFEVPLTKGGFARLRVQVGKPAAPGRVGWRTKSSTHRCFLTCPDCGREVPAGRSHQHKCKN